MGSTVVDGGLNRPLSIAFGQRYIYIFLLIFVHGYLSIIINRMRIYSQALLRSDVNEPRPENPARLTVVLLINFVKGQKLPKDH